MTLTPDQRVALSRAHRLERLDIRERETQVRLDQLENSDREKLIRDTWRRCNGPDADRHLRRYGVFSCAVAEVEPVSDFSAQIDPRIEIETIHFQLKRKSIRIFAIVCEDIEVGEMKE